MRMTKLSTGSLSMPNTRVRSAIVASTVAAVIGLAAPSTSFANKGEDRSRSTCYTLRPDLGVTNTINNSPLAIRYLTENLGSLNSDSEVRNFGHLKQYAYDLTGKATLLLQHDVVDSALQNGGDIRIMSTASGAAVVGIDTYGLSRDQEGAHLGLTINFGRTVFDDAFVGPLFLECSTPETSVTPYSWHCTVKAEGMSPADIGLAFGLATEIDLQKANPGSTPACSVFEDGEYFPRLPVVHRPPA